MNEIDSGYGFRQTIIYTALDETMYKLPIEFNLDISIIGLTIITGKIDVPRERQMPWMLQSSFKVFYYKGKLRGKGVYKVTIWNLPDPLERMYKLVDQAYDQISWRIAEHFMDFDDDVARDESLLEL